MPIITLPNNGWTPRSYQRKLWDFLRNSGKRGVEVAHRRWGKDDVVLHSTSCASQERVGNYWHMLPEFEQCRKAIWNAVNPHTGKRRIDEAFPEGMRRSKNEQQMMLKFRNGSTWQLVGSDNYNSLMGSPPIGVVFSEYSLADPLAWAYIRPILLENKGWAVFIYTARGDNHGKRMYEMAKEEMESGNKDWFAEKSTVGDTDVFTGEQLAQELKELIAEMGDEDEATAHFNQEYWCSFEGAVAGSYYGKVIEQARRDGRITFVPYMVGNPVYTFWDLGFDDSTTIWFMQHVGNKLNFIDYYENSRMGLDHYAEVLLKEKRYLYGDHFWPHDAAQSSLQTGLTNQEYGEKIGITPITVVPRARDGRSVINGINQGRRVFNQCWFDERKCAHGLSALSSYRSEYDKKKRKPSNYPIHNWASHGADAFRTFSVGYEPRIPVESVSDMMIRKGMMLPR